MHLEKGGGHIWAMALQDVLITHSPEYPDPEKWLTFLGEDRDIHLA